MEFLITFFWSTITALGAIAYTIFLWVFTIALAGLSAILLFCFFLAFAAVMAWVWAYITEFFNRS